MTTSAELLARLRGLHPQLIDLSLGRIERLLGKLGDPQRRLPPVIHVAGTNGKGSVCAYLKAMIEAAGKRAQVFTSPHLVRFHERIELPGRDGRARPIAEADLVDALERTEAANAGEPLTFFEITTAAALLAFAETPADVLVLEVGLGGRLDATNVVDQPAVTVVTSIAMDHMHYLGDTLEKIAFEKAGILKRGCPCVVARQEEAALEVIHRQARKVGAPLIVAGEQFEAFEQNGRLIFQDETTLGDFPLPALLGRHQVGNAGVAISAAHALRRHLAIPDAAIERGLTAARWPARMQPLSSSRLARHLRPGSELWLDGAHNPAGAEVAASTMADLEERAPKPLYLVVGMLKTKDAQGVLGPFRGIARKMLAVPIPGDATARTARDVAAEALVAGLEVITCESVEDALREIAQIDVRPARVLICGSLHLAGHVLALEEGVEAQMN